MKQQSGFTVIEALVTVTVVAVLVSVAVPSFTTTIKNGRLATQGNDLLGAMLFARSQAIANSKIMTVCVSDTNLTGCVNSSNWENGWVVGVSDGGTGITGAPLRVHEALTGGNTLRNDASAKLIKFQAGNGFPTAATDIYFSLCDSRGTSYGRAILVNYVGEARVSPTPGKEMNGTTTMPSCP